LPPSLPPPTPELRGLLRGEDILFHRVRVLVKKWKKHP